MLDSVLERRAEPRLTVAVDINPFWENLTGVGWYLYQLLEALSQRDDVRLRLYGPRLIKGPDSPPPTVELPQGPAIEEVTHGVQNPKDLPAGWLLRWLHWLQPVLVAADGNRVVFAPNFFLPNRMILARGAQVATIHDLGLLLVPWTLQEETLENLERRLDRVLAISDRVLTPSESVRSELQGLKGVQSWRVQAIHHGPGQLADISPGDLPSGLPGSFALFVGTLEPRKNLTLLLKSWEKLGEGAAEPPVLVLCGRYGWKNDQLREQMDRLENLGLIRWLGYVSDSELAALYKQAKAVVLPSLYEGFGLPVVEALWAGCPLVLSDIPVLREVAGGAALYAPPDDVDAWVEALARVLTDDQIRQELAQAAAERVQSFHWDRAAELALESFFAAAGEKRGPGA
jgi:alpha-1,3-rhamnosyl/mannosyltransferase